MSVYAGPEIVSDSLVFAYDMANTQKSWKGAPTVNLFGTNLLATNSQKTLSNITYNGWVATGVANDVPRTTLFSGSIAVAASTFYTLSCLYWSSNNIVDDVYLRFSDTGWPESVNYIQPFTTQSVNRNGSFSITDLGGGWKYCVGTFQTLATTTTLGELFFDVDVAGVEVFISNIQLEQNTFATPYVNGTRTNTQAIVDLTGLNTVTANSLTYASDNTFSFVGPNNDTLGNYISLGNPVILNFGTGNFTLSFLTYRTADGYQGGSYVGKGNGTSIGFDFRDGSYFIYGSTGLIASMGFTALNNVWQYHSFVFDRTTSPYITYYRNGIAFASSNVNNSANILSSIDTTRSLDIGRSQAGGPNRYFNGKMPHVQIYNRALSASEIKQNFNATRSRYGI